MGRDRAHRAPVRQICYWVLDVVVCCVVVTTAGDGCVVVLVTLSDATPLLFWYVVVAELVCVPPTSVLR